MMDKLVLDVISDVVCPWCYLGKRRLDRAIAALPEIGVSVRWRPYQLDPSIPAGGLERKAYMRAKFGDDGRLRAAHERLVELGAAEGIRFDFEAIAVAPNTLDAHRVIRWGQTAGAGAQHALVEGLFSIYFEKGGDLGDAETLAGAAAEAGMDAPVVRTLLASQADREAVEDEIATASRMGVTGVPCFLIESRYAVMGAQDVDVLADALRRIAGAKARGELDQPAEG